MPGHLAVLTEARFSQLLRVTGHGLGVTGYESRVTGHALGVSMRRVATTATRVSRISSTPTRCGAPVCFLTGSLHALTMFFPRHVSRCVCLLVRTWTGTGHQNVIFPPHAGRSSPFRGREASAACTRPGAGDRGGGWRGGRGDGGWSAGGAGWGCRHGHTGAPSRRLVTKFPVIRALGLWCLRALASSPTTAPRHRRPGTAMAMASYDTCRLLELKHGISEGICDDG